MSIGCQSGQKHKIHSKAVFFSERQCTQVTIDKTASFDTIKKWQILH
jgi:hypothetical protein